MPSLYNDIDPFACEWLRELIRAGLIPAGTVDGRSIKDIKPEDLEGYDYVHLFAGVGGWCEALRLAGWPNGIPVLTASCPCQPFSTAGQGRGTSDERHLWPDALRLIATRRPPVIFGEQVASKAARIWMANVRQDLEAIGYAVGIARLPARCVGANHFRYRFYFVAHSMCSGLEGLHAASRGVDLQSTSQNIPGHDWKATPRVLQRVDGVSRRLDRPKFYREQIVGYGNAIVPQLAAVFIRAFMDTLEPTK